eukprot:COSAG06_NODE_2548_length_6692_cov_35.291066_8_plen_107_part_00
MAAIDRATSNVLRAKFAARLFDERRYRDTAADTISKFVNNPEHLALARSAAHEGCVLLKNAAPPPPAVPSNCSDGAQGSHTTANCIIIDHFSTFEPGLVAPFLYAA